MKITCQDVYVVQMIKFEKLRVNFCVTLTLNQLNENFFIFDVLECSNQEIKTIILKI